MAGSEARPYGSRPTRLPGFLRDVEEAAGRDAAISVALELGGEEIHVPKPGRILRREGIRLRRWKLLLLLDDDQALALADRMGGCSVYVPFARRAIANAMHERGRKPEEIAAAMGVSRRQIRRYLRGA